MLDRLPYELIRRILDEAHPPFADSTCDSPSSAASHARLRFLSHVERTCKSVQGVAHDLLWHTVWIRPVAESAKQLDRLLNPNRDESSLVRVFNFARHDKRKTDAESCVKLASVMQALGKMDKVVEISLRQHVEGGTVDFGELLQRQCLRTLIIEGDSLQLSLGINPSFESVILPNLRHLALENVVLSSSIDGLLASRLFPVLKSVSLQGILVDGKPSFPKIEPELLQQLESIDVSLDAYALYQSVLQSKPERVFVHLDRRSCLSLLRDNDKGVKVPLATFGRAVKTLVLSTEEIMVSVAQQGEPVAPTIRLAHLIVRGRLVSTLYRPRTLRTDIPTCWTNIEDDIQDGIERRVAECEAGWYEFDQECVEQGVKIFYLDRDEDVERWPSSAQADPSLRRMVAAVQQRDQHREKAHEQRERPQHPDVFPDFIEFARTLDFGIGGQ